MTKRLKKVASKSTMVAAASLMVATPLISTSSAIAADEQAKAEPTDSAAKSAETKVDVPNESALKAKAEEATKAGVKVNTKDTETRNFSVTEREAEVKKATADYDSQVKTLDSAIAEQKANDAAYEKAVAERNAAIEQNKKIDAQNAAAEKAHAEAVKAEEEVKKAAESITAKIGDFNKAKGAGSAELKAAVTAWQEANKTWDGSADFYAQKMTELDKAAGTEQAKKVMAEIAAYQKAAAERGQALADAISALEAVQVKNAALKEDFLKQMEVYEAQMKEYQKLVDEQTKNADPNKAIVAPATLAYQQPFTVDVQAQNLTSVTGSFDQMYKSKEGVKVFNSDYMQIIPVKDGDSITSVWKNRATDAETGRSLDLTIEMTDITTAPSDRQFLGNGYETFPGYTPVDENHGYISNTPLVSVYSNSVDSFNFNMVAGAKLKYTYTYSDTGEKYAKDYYITTGSHDWAGTMDGSPSYDYEFSAPLTGVKATFLNKDSYLSDTVREVRGVGSKVTPVAYGVKAEMNNEVYPQDILYHDDSGDYVFNRIGVTYLVENGASIATGVSYTNEANSERREMRTEGAPYAWVGQHYMSTVQTVAPTEIAPVKPAEPAYEPENAEIGELIAVPVLSSPLEPVKTSHVDVPAEPVKKVASADVRYLNLVEQLADLRIAKTVVDNDASDGEISFRVDGTNKGPGVAWEAAIDDLGGDGITSVALSDVIYNGEALVEGKGSVEGSVLSLKEVRPSDTFSFTVTAKVDPNLDVVTNAVKVTSPDDPTKGTGEDTQRNDGVDDDTDGKDAETTPLKATAKVRLDKKFLSFDEATGVATFEVKGVNEKGIAHDVVIEDFGGLGLSDVKVQSFSSELPAGESKSESADSVVEDDKKDTTAAPSESASPSASASASAPADGLGDGAGRDDSNIDNERPQVAAITSSGDVTVHRSTAYQGSSFPVVIFEFGSLDEAKASTVELGKPTGAVSVSYDNSGNKADQLAVTVKDNAVGELVIPYTITTADGVTTAYEERIQVIDKDGNKIEGTGGSGESTVAPEASPSESAPADGGPTESRPTSAVKAADQDKLKSVDVKDTSDFTVDGAKVTVDAMGIGETFTMVVTAKVADTARSIENSVGVTTPDDPEAKGKDGSQVNEDVPGDEDGWDKTVNELQRPADLKVLKEVVDGDATDGSVSFRITGANLGVGDAPDVTLEDMKAQRTGLTNPKISEVKLGEGELAADRYSVAEDNQSITLGTLNSGEQVSYLITFDVEPGATEVANAASITSPFDPVNPEGDIQPNDDIPGDNDQKDKVSVKLGEPALKVDKEVVDGDISDGKATFRIKGGNFGGTIEKNVMVSDAEREGFSGGVISEVKAPEGVQATVEGSTGVKLDKLAPGQVVEFLITFEADPNAAAYSNVATIGSDNLKPGGGEPQVNGSLEEDTDQKDKVVIEKPAVETPATPAEQPVVKGETARTGSGAEAVRNGLLGLLGLGAVGGGGFAIFRSLRKGKGEELDS